MDKQQKYLVKKFHTLISQGGIDQDTKLAMLARYGVESSKDLDAHQLMELCDALERAINPTVAELDRWRKRVMAAIGGWLKLMGREQNPTLIKGIACQAAQRERFNSIPIDRLRSIYHSFLKQQKDLEFAAKLTRDELDIKTYQN